jgi:adenylate kinase family enzyme
MCVHLEFWMTSWEKKRREKREGGDLVPRTQTKQGQATQAFSLGHPSHTQTSSEQETARENMRSEAQTDATAASGGLRRQEPTPSTSADEGSVDSDDGAGGMDMSIAAAKELPSLVIVRGPSGAGKSTVSQNLCTLLRARFQKKVALIESDLVQHKMLVNMDRKATAAVMMAMARASWTDADCDIVVVEGVLNVKRPDYLHMLEELVELAPTKSRPPSIFYLDVPLEETFKRHAGRPKHGEFTTDDMRDWWSAASPWGHDLEIVVDQTSGESSKEERTRLWSTCSLSCSAKRPRK